MKKYLIIAGILIAFTAITFNSPAKVITVDDQQISYVDDTTKVQSKTSVTSKESVAKCCSSKTTKSTKDCCKIEDPKCCKEEKSTKACCKTVKKK